MAHPIARPDAPGFREACRRRRRGVVAARPCPNDCGRVDAGRLPTDAQQLVAEPDHVAILERPAPSIFTKVPLRLPRSRSSRRPPSSENDRWRRDSVRHRRSEDWPAPPAEDQRRALRRRDAARFRCLPRRSGRLRPPPASCATSHCRPALTIVPGQRHGASFSDLQEYAVLTAEIPQLESGGSVRNRGVLIRQHRVLRKRHRAPCRPIVVTPFSMSGNSSAGVPSESSATRRPGLGCAGRLCRCRRRRDSAQLAEPRAAVFAGAGRRGRKHDANVLLALEPLLDDLGKQDAVAQRRFDVAAPRSDA